MCPRCPEKSRSRHTGGTCGNMDPIPPQHFVVEMNQPLLLAWLHSPRCAVHAAPHGALPCQLYSPYRTVDAPLPPATIQTLSPPSSPIFSRSFAQSTSAFKAAAECQRAPQRAACRKDGEGELLGAPLRHSGDAERCWRYKAGSPFIQQVLPRPRPKGGCGRVSGALVAAVAGPARRRVPALRGAPQRQATKSDRERPRNSSS